MERSWVENHSNICYSYMDGTYDLTYDFCKSCEDCTDECTMYLVWSSQTIQSCSNTQPLFIKLRNTQQVLHQNYFYTIYLLSFKINNISILIILKLNLFTYLFLYHICITEMHLKMNSEQILWIILMWNQHCYSFPSIVNWPRNSSAFISWVHPYTILFWEAADTKMIKTVLELVEKSSS